MVAAGMEGSMETSIVLYERVSNIVSQLNISEVASGGFWGSKKGWKLAANDVLSTKKNVNF